MSDDKNESERLLSELQSLNNTLENDPFDLDSEQQLEDLPVLKSFVEDVPLLSDRIVKEEPQVTPTRLPEQSAENDPLAISEFVKQQRAAGLAAASPSEATAPTSPTTPTPAITPQKSSAPSRPNSSLENNPFLPQSAKDRIRNTQHDASSQLHDLLRQSAKVSFNDGRGSSEYQRLRDKASVVIDEIVRAHLPRLEAELRMRLEAEVNTMLREQKKD